MELTSLQYSKLLKYLAFERHQVVLNKTQVNKLLFICYGCYLAEKKVRLFSEAPHAWPFGPVFPTVYRKFESISFPVYFTQDELDAFHQNEYALLLCAQTIDKFCHVGAYDLSAWSHKDGSPWYKTVFSETPVKWNKEINNEVIEEYFKGGLEKLSI